MKKAKYILLNEARKLRAKIFRKKKEIEQLEKEAEELEEKANQMSF